MRQELIAYLKSFIGSRYQWGGEGPYNVGFDCSGFILEGLRAFGLWGRSDSSSQTLFVYFANRFGKTKEISIGCLLFFGKDEKNISHIGMAISPGQYIEAGGGDSKSVDKGMVRIRPINWRSDLVGVVQIFKD